MRALAIDQRMARLGFGLRSIPGLEAAWLSRFPSGLGTMRLPADGTPMGTWVDLSGNGRDLTQATSAKRPLWKANGGIPGMQFNGVNSFFSTAPFNLSGPRTFYAVHQVTNVTTPATMPLYDGRVNGVERNQLAYDVSGDKKLATYTTAGGTHGALGPVIDLNRHVTAITFDSAPHAQYLDGTNIGTVTTGIDNITQGVNVGADRTAGSNIFNGLIHDLLICSQAHDDATRQRIEAWLARKNGVTLA